MPLGYQLVVLFVLAMPVACIAWTITHEEVFREARETCVAKSKWSRKAYQRKFFYVFTCEYCVSHYATLFILLLSGYTLLFQGWRGYVIAWFSLVWVANIYMSIFARLRLGIRRDRAELAAAEQERETNGMKTANTQTQ